MNTGPNRSPRIRWLRVLLPAVVLGAAACSTSPLNVEVTFDTPLGLVPGAELLWDEVPVGSVTGLEWKEGSEDPCVVQVRVEPAHRGKVTRDTRFVLGVANFDEPVYFLTMNPGEGPAAEDGQRFEGRVSLSARLTGAVWRSVDEVLRPELERLLNDVGRDLDEAARYGREQWEVLGPELERRVAELTLIAREEGNRLGESARRELEVLLQRYDELIDRYGTPSEGGGAEED